MSGEILEPQSFELHFKVTISAYDRGEKVTIDFYIEDASPRGSGRGVEFEFPRKHFKSDEQRNEWVAATLKELKAFRGALGLLDSSALSVAMMEEARAHLTDCGNFTLSLMGIDPEPVTLKYILDQHLASTSARVRHYFDKLKTKRSAWSDTELEREVSLALATIKPHLRTIARVHKKFRKEFADVTPKQASSFRKLLNRHKVDWEKLKGTVPFSDVSLRKGTGTKSIESQES